MCAFGKRGSALGTAVATQVCHKSYVTQRPSASATASSLEQEVEGFKGTTVLSCMPSCEQYHSPPPRCFAPPLRPAASPRRFAVVFAKGIFLTKWRTWSKGLSLRIRRGNMRCTRGRCRTSSRDHRESKVIDLPSLGLQCKLPAQAQPLVVPLDAALRPPYECAAVAPAAALVLPQG